MWLPIRGLEYLGCQTINRWVEHAKRAKINSAHAINLSNPSIPHLIHAETHAAVSPHCALLDMLSLTSSGVSSMRGKFQEKSTIKSSIGLTLTLPLLLCEKHYFLICHPEQSWRGLKISCQRSIIKQEFKVQNHCVHAEVVYPWKAINSLNTVPNVMCSYSLSE